MNDYCTFELYLLVQATDKIKDWDILHTNLAQAHIRLGQFDSALEACTWAFRVGEIFISVCRSFCC